MVEIFKALGDDNRLRIINILLKAELCVCEIEVLLDLTQSNVSRHLNKLKSAGIISSSKDAQWIHYKLDDKFLADSSELMTHIKDNFKKEKVFIYDSERYEKYKANNMNCKIIKEDKEKVIEIIK